MRLSKVAGGGLRHKMLMKVRAASVVARCGARAGSPRGSARPDSG
jgi:hypothetical protein